MYYKEIMQINRNNYEEYFLLYTDNELDAQERMAVEEFAAGNPDLQEELIQLQQYRMVPEKITFPGKENLLRQTGNGFIHTANHEACFLLYADNELTGQQRMQVEQFVQDHPGLQEEFALISKAVLTPDTSIVFPEKKRLYRHEHDKVIPFAWREIAAAAAIVLIAGALLWNGYHRTTTLESPVAQQQDIPENRQSQHSNPVNASSGQKPAVTNPDRLLPKQEAPVATPVRQPEPALAVYDNKAPGRKKEKSILFSQPHLEKDVRPVHANSVALNTIPSTIKTTEPVIDRPAVFFDPTEAEDVHDSNTSFASNTNTEDVYITNVPVDKKIPLRGLLRKASRIINKATGLNTNEKGILIGNLAIAVK